MPEATVYSWILQTSHTDRTATRLLNALQELAGRAEVRDNPAVLPDDVT